MYLHTYLITGENMTKEALAQPNFCSRCGKRLGANDWDMHTCTPPQRTWVGLTEEEIDKCFEFIIEEDTQAIKFAQAIEAKLKEKNT